ncbi:MAG: hypothetical protein ACFFD4_12535 [Candidatus Odinarchaeota archaeon]
MRGRDVAVLGTREKNYGVIITNALGWISIASLMIIKLLEMIMLLNSSD